MSSSNARNIVELRQLLADKFPGVRMSADRPETLANRNHFPTGLPRLDSLLDGGLPKGAITEIVSPGIASGTSLLIASLLERAREHGEWIALIDSSDSFDPTPFPNEILSRLLWVRCSDPRQAIKATDLLLHDATLSIVVLDLLFSPPNLIRKTPSSTWFRLQRILENTATAFVVLAPEHMISNAAARFTLEKRFSLESLDLRRETLLAQVAPAPLEAGKQRIVKIA